MKDLSRTELIEKYINLCELGREAINFLMDDIAKKRPANMYIVTKALVKMNIQLEGYKL